MQKLQQYIQWFMRDSIAEFQVDYYTPGCVEILAVVEHRSRRDNIRDMAVSVANDLGLQIESVSEDGSEFAISIRY